MTGEDTRSAEPLPLPEPRSGFVSRAPKLGYAGPIDGLRGAGMIMVIFAHAAYTEFASFAAAVDMFFVASGFLITTLVLEEDRSSGTVSLRNFYVRRGLRLLPLLYLVLACTLVSFWLLGDHDLFQKTLSDVAAGGLYVYHVVHPVAHEVIGGGWPEVRPLIQLWSLSVEEHFYLFGVLIVLFVIRRKWVVPLMVSFVALWVFIGTARALGHVGPRLAWYQRPDALLMGVVIAFLNAHMPAVLSKRAEWWMRRGTDVSIFVLAVVVFVGTVFAKPFNLFVPFGPEKGGSLHDGLYWGEFGFSATSLTMAVIILTIVRFPDHWVAKVLLFKPFVFIGVRSYAIYLIHVPLGVFLVEGLGQDHPALAVLLYLPLLALFTELAHRWVEKPAFRLKSRWAPSTTSGRHDATPTTKPKPSTEPEPEPT